jgi:diadenosine tetraphosphate (Ap4A) HIT family hydrolase
MQNINCPFCEKFNFIIENDYWFAIYDKYPVNQGHTLIIPKRHYSNYFESKQEELECFNDILFKVKDYLLEKFNPQGFNVGFNVNKEGGQTVFHTHIHVIPRYTNDVKNPEGGVRGVIPSKQSYNG